ncbi:kinesin-like protein KIF16B [Watersipora subatra]|uniref:kinesin-like protein KIF16B n=1 Tax=Watersipora subatra TaxID=2589382 RepID=UPI00355BB750
MTADDIQVTNFEIYLEIDGQAKVVIGVNCDTVSITNPKLDASSTQLDIADSREKVKSFVFDYAYLSADRTAQNYASQELIFEDLGSEVLEAAFGGYNACIFAYGQTGSGKTYTMMGDVQDVGLTPRILQGLFSRMDEAQSDPQSNVSCRVDVSYMEIYNERVRDLLRPSAAKKGQGLERYTLKVREHPKDGPYVQDLSRHIVKDNVSVQALLDRGNEKRITAATHYHDHSSRSHAIFTINFTQAKLEKDLPCETVSKIHLVDLAGSERANITDYDKDRLKEGANINKSLVTLGNVIKALANQSSNFAVSQENLSGSLMGSAPCLLSNSDLAARSASPVPRKKTGQLFVPYRDSVLTWLLKDSLGGNSKTFMIANISPSSIYYAETLNTLRYAQRTKSIINKPTVNEDSNVKLIRDLRGEIERLRQLLVTSHMAQSTRSLTDMDTGLVERLEENEAVAKSMLTSWLDKWQEAHDIMRASQHE